MNSSSLPTSFPLDLKLSPSAPPAYEQTKEEEDTLATRTGALLGSRAVQAILADAVLTVVLSLYSSIHQLVSLVSSSRLTLACAHLPPPHATHDTLPAHLVAICAEVRGIAARESVVLGSAAARWVLLGIVVVKATGAGWYLCEERRGGWSLTKRSAKPCDLVVTSIAGHALLGFSSFLLLPLLPSPAQVLDAPASSIAGGALVVIGIALALSGMAKPPRSERGVALV